MYRKILLAYDGSSDGRGALDEAADIAMQSQAEVVLLAVVDVGMEVANVEGTGPGGAIDEQMRQVREVLAEGSERLTARGIKASTSFLAGHPGERIAALAREIGADLIVLGHRPHGLWSRWLQEPVGPFLLSDPPCSLLVCVARSDDGH